ncbi:Transcriptional regulator, AraC family [Streptomyces formicae]|uniref:Transcriptional regulator, AraC family n=2 Tax=Streptomyces formicae TaxID=1616117 RepID=A0A291QMM4_9ACTN|nr:Transcriptional regulator, AraC family [Streptomyces formicae]
MVHDVRASHDLYRQAAQMDIHPRLRPGVLCYRGHGGPPAVTELRPDAVTLRLGFGRTGEREFTSFVAGLSTHARAVPRPAESWALDVLLEPWAAFALFGTAMHKITDSVVAPGPVLGTRFQALHGALATATSWPERFAVLDRTLSGWSTTGQACSPELVRAWLTVRRTGGTVPIQHLAQQTGWCWRRLDYRFRQQIGLAPKTAARVVRLRRALVLLARGGGLADIAARCGFSDQAHLSREVKTMTGRTPGQLVAAYG